MDKVELKKQWKEPAHVRYGDVAEITNNKSPGTFDGHGLPKGQGGSLPHPHKWQ